MKIYTKTGDQGETSLLGGKRVPKDSLRVEAYGSVDELNSSLGLSCAFIEKAKLKEILHSVQNDLLNLGSELADGRSRLSSRPKATRSFSEVSLRKTNWEKRTNELEKIIDDLTAKLPELRNFILPGGDKGAAFLHLSRSICRRAERRVVSLTTQEEVNTSSLPYLNRLSDLLFILARYTNHLKGVKDQIWKK